MISWRAGRVTALGRAWRGALELTADVDGTAVKALAYPILTGEPVIGDKVLLNTTALTMGLGTGGYAMVVALPDRLPNDEQPGPGHLVKARYTPLQAVVLGAEEQDSPHYERLREADSLDGMPVVTADLHSALPAVCAAILADRPGTRIAYVMSDGGALPLWFSRTVAGLRDAWSRATRPDRIFPGQRLKLRLRLISNRMSPRLYVIFICSIAAIGGLLFGYDTAVISGATESVQARFS